MKPTPPISALSHKEFDEHWLRAYAFAMPWYRASSQWQSPYDAQAFTEHTRSRIIETVGEKNLPEQALRPNAPFLQHVSHWLLRDAVYTHVGTLKEYELKHVIRHDLKRIAGDGVFVIPDNRHPLHGHREARDTQSAMGYPMKIVHAQERDKKLAVKFSADNILNAVLHEAVPQVIEADPAMRIAEYSPQLRARMRKALEKKQDLTDAERGTLVQDVENEWVKVSSTDATKTCERVLAEHGMPDLLSEPTQDVIQKLATLPLTKEMEPVRRSALELLALRCAQGDDVDDLERVVKGMQAFLRENNLEFCDRPSCGVASLSLFIRFTGVQKILSRI